MSDRDISAGSWSPHWMKALRTSDACIARLTRENLDAEWIHFEAGAIM
ncbi:MAG: toll/interleukin-1 receptor domain-containing protein, partial [Armatimonadetes bacterium]|nr:toll/interleukin-1 receptor domain-containing protein [Akkermansiaceae bacterium]